MPKSAPKTPAAKRTTRKTTTTSASTSDETAAKKTTRKTSRGRRGGASRRKTPATPATATESPAVTAEPAPAETAARTSRAAPKRDAGGSQLAVLQSIQESLASIEHRLSNGQQSNERQRQGVFVDVPNVMYAAERQRVTIDFAKMLDFLRRDRELLRASAYAPISDDPTAKLETQKFVQPFVGLNYRIVTKALKRYADGSMKANFDVELAIDILTMSDRLDVVTLVSGDGDFRRLVDLIASRGVRVEVVAFAQSMAGELRAVADEYIDINAHLDILRAQ